MAARYRQLNMTFHELHAIAEMFFEVDDFLCSLENRGIVFGENVNRIRRMRRMLRNIFLLGCRPRTAIGQRALCQFVDRFDIYFFELLDLYLT
ncbi:unnamed protein product [Caenorhabditis brenneri]